MSLSSQSPTGFQAYLSKLRMFSHNARMVLIYSALTGLAFGVFRLLFNFYVLSLGGYTESFLGNLTSAQSTAALLMALPAAYIAERFSQKKIMMASGVISVLAFLGIVSLPFRLPLILFSITQGLAASIRQVASAPFLMNNTGQEERQYVFSFNFGMMTFASFVGNQLGGYLPLWLSGMLNVEATATPAYRFALAGMMLVSVLAIGPLMAIRRTKHDDNQQASPPLLFTDFMTGIKGHTGTLIKLVLPNVLIGLGAGLAMPFMNLYYRNVLGQPDPIIGTLFGVGALGMAVAQFISPPLADRLGKINTVILTQALSIPFLLMLGITAYIISVRGREVNLQLWFWIAAVAYLIRASLMNLGGPVYTTFILEQVDDNMQAITQSLNGISFRFGWAVMPSISGWLQTKYGTMGFTFIFAMVAGFYVLGIICERVFFREAVRRGRQQRLRHAHDAQTAATR